MNNKYYKTLRFTHAALTLLLATFFIMKGIQKFGPVKLRDKHITAENKELIVQKIIEQQNYEAPYGYDITMNTMRQSGFLKVIGVFQVLAGILMLFPRTRMAGLLVLLPVILNIFLMHLFFDNRPHENSETGMYLALTILLLLFYSRYLWNIIWLKKPSVK